MGNSGRSTNLGKTKKRRGEKRKNKWVYKRPRTATTEGVKNSSKFCTELDLLMKEEVQVDYKIIGKTEMKREDKAQIKKQRYPKLVEMVLLSGEVWECPIQKYIVRQGNNDGSKYKQQQQQGGEGEEEEEEEEDHMRIRVNMSNLRDTMIPFGNKLKEESNKVGREVNAHEYRKNNNGLWFIGWSQRVQIYIIGMARSTTDWEICYHSQRLWIA